MKKKLISLVCACMMLFSMSGCRKVRSGVVYTVYPLGYLIERLAGNSISSVSIQDNTIVQRASIRSDFKDILDSNEVFFHIGDLEPYLSVYANEINSSGIERNDLSSLNAIYEFKRYTQVITGDEVTFIEGPYYRGEAFDNVDMNKLDLYLWNDPIAMLSMAKDIYKELVDDYPENEALYTSNLEILEADLINLDAQYQMLATSLVSNSQEIKFVSVTASFGNWQKTYGFQVYPVILSKYGVLPDEAQLEIIKNRIIRDDVRYIVYEPNMTPDMIELFDRLESELSLVRVELSNLSSLTEAEEAEGKDYISVMYENLTVLDTMKTPIAGSVPAGTAETPETSGETAP